MRETEYKRYIFIDTETGGINPQKHSLLSIGLVAWDIEKGFLDGIEVFIKHENYVITKEAQSINGFNSIIHDKKAVDCKTSIKSIETFMYKYFDKNTLVPLAGHNIQFDTNFLKQFLIYNNRSYNSMFSHRMLDTSSVLRTLIIAGLLPDNIYNLTDALRFFNINIEQRHSALDDAKATVSLYEEMINIIQNGAHTWTSN